MGTQGTGRKRNPNKERTTAEDDALNLIAREAEARLAAKRAARAEAREIRMKELERQQKEIFQVQKKYYGLDNKPDAKADSRWGDIEQWMEDSERYSRPSRKHTSISDDDERMSVGSRGSVRSDLDPTAGYAGAGSSSSFSLKKSKKKKKHKHKDRDSTSCDDDVSALSSRSSRLSDESKMSRDESRASRSSRLDLTSSRLSDESRLSRPSRLDVQPASYASSDVYGLNGLSSSRQQGSSYNGYQGSLYEDSLYSTSRRVTSSSSRPTDYSSYRGPGSRASSRASSARASPTDDSSSVASFLRTRDLDHVTIPNLSDAEDRDYLEKGSRAASTLSTVTIASLGGTSSRRGSGDTAITADTEAASLREIKEIHELKDQIQDVESKYMQNLKGVKDALVEVEEKYRKAMVSNAQLDNEKGTLMYHVDTLKDSLMELEESLAEARRGHQDKAKDYEREKHAHEILQFHFNELKETLKQSEELLTEIRQLRMKEDGFNREISDLQETVEWKDKKIGALERQKEYSDAIRNERDELRDEVVQLKDVLKKHGIVIGETTTNGETAEAGTNGGDPASRLAQDSRTPPAEGNSILGGARETQTESTGGAELGRAESRQRQQIQEEEEEEEEGQENRLTPPDHSSLASVPETEPPREKQTGSKIEGDASKDLDNDFAIVEVIKSVGSSEVQVIVTGPGDEIKAEGEGCKAAGPEGGDVGELGSASAGEDGAGSNQVKVDDLETVVGKSSSDLNDEPSPKKPTADEDTSQQEPRYTENAEDKKTEEPSPEEPLLEEPSSENRSPEEPSLEEPLQEEPSPQEPSLVEPSLEEPSSEKPSPEEPPLEEPLQEEPSPEEPSLEEPSPQEPSLEEPSSEKPLPEEHSPELTFSQSQPQGGSTPSKKKKKKKRAKKKKGAQGDGAQEDDTKTKRKNPAGPVAPATREEEPGKETGVETQRSPMEILRESHTDQAKDQSPVIENDHKPIQVSCSESDSAVSNPRDDPKCRTGPDDPNVEPEPPTKTDGIQINSESSESNDVLKDNSEPTSKTDNVADESQQTRNTGALGDTSEFSTNTENEGEFESQTKTETSQSTANGDSLDCSDIHTGCTTKSDSFVDCPETPVDLKCQSTSIISDGVKEEDAIAVSESSATAKTIKQEPGVDCHSSDMLSPELEENVEHKDLLHTVVQVSISPDRFSAKATEDLEEMVQEEINWRDKEPGIDNDDKLPEDSDKCCDTSLDSNCKDEQSVDRSDRLPDNKLLNEVCEAEGVDAAPMAACLTEQVHVESGSGTEGSSDPSSRATMEVARPSLPLGEEQEDSDTNQQDNELKPIRQISEEEEEENEEGQSFDFDDVDSEVFGDVPKTHQGNAEQGLETESKEDNGSTMQHSPINTIKEEEPDEDMGAQLLTQEEPNKSRKGCVWDRLTEQKDPAVEASETEAPEEDVDGTPDEHQSPNEKKQTAVVDVCSQSEGQLASVAEGGASLAHGQRELSGEGLGLTVGQQSIAEGESVQSRAQAGPGEEGPVDNGFRGERLSSQKTADQGGENDERSRKGSKSNSKKGKGKGKDDLSSPQSLHANYPPYHPSSINGHLLHCMLVTKLLPPWPRPHSSMPLAPPIPEIRLRKLVDERESLIGQVKKLEAQVEQKRPRPCAEDGSSPQGSEALENGTDPNTLDMQRDASRQLSDLKFKLVKAEQEVTALEQNVTRLEGQVTRYKSGAENSEKVEDELKAEKRKLQRELRTALDKVDELESNNSHLSKRLDKMKANRSTAATP